MNKIYPWHESTWNKLTTRIEKIPHGLLFSGQPGIGKYELANRLAALLICDAPQKSEKKILEACHKCKSCLLNESGNHPDFILISPKEDKKVISVDQTRELSRQLQLKSHISKRKVAIIHPAELMNKNAANSLLKLLEEPPQNNVLILVTDKISFLSMTIKSRCIKFNIPLPDENEAIGWLQEQDLSGSISEENITSILGFSGCAPLFALDLINQDFSQTRKQLLNDVVAVASNETNLSVCAKKWKEIGSGMCLLWFQGFLADLVKITMTNKIAHKKLPGSIMNQELVAGLQLPKKALNLLQLFDFIDVVSESKRLLNAPMDEQLLLEDVLIRWQGLVKA